MNGNDGQTGHIDSGPASTENDKTNEESCYCKHYIEDSLWIECDSCSKWFHIDCVGLKGLGEDHVGLIKQYKCPYCILKTSVLIKLSETIRETVQQVVKETMESSDLCSKTDMEQIVKVNADKAVKSYAEATAASQKQVLDEMSVAQASKNVVEEVTRKMDNDNVEREKRRLNICVIDIPESVKEEAKHRNGDDLIFCSEKLGINKEDIVSCYRAGKKSSTDNDSPRLRPRPLIIKVVNQNAVDYYTDCGKGWRTDFKLDSGMNAYLNPDLCKADRDANFLVRLKRKERRAKEKKEEEEKQSLMKDR